MDDKIVELIKSQKDKGLMLIQQQYAGLIHYIVRGMSKDQGGYVLYRYKVGDESDNYSTYAIFSYVHLSSPLRLPIQGQRT